MKDFFKSWHRRTQAGFIALAFLITTGLWVRFYFLRQTTKNPQVIEDQLIINKIDSLRKAAGKQSQPVIYPFNPNYLTDYTAYRLGMDTGAFRRIKAYRLSGKYFHSAKEFQRISGISDSLFEILKPYIQFPDYAWDTTRRPRGFKKTVFSRKKIYPTLKKDINSATEEDLKKVYGIGEKLSKRIVRYREKLGGYSIKEQLKDIYALPPETYNELWKYFEIKTPKPINGKVSINRATIRELRQNPYIDFDLAEKIVEYRELHGNFKKLEDLKNIPGFPVEKYKRIVLYLTLK